MNILKSYRLIRPKKVKYPIPKIPDDSEEKNRVRIGYCQKLSGRVSGTRQALSTAEGKWEKRILEKEEISLKECFQKKKQKDWI